jgi:hypothetical protein
MQSRGHEFTLSKASAASNKVGSPSKQWWPDNMVPLFFPQRLRSPLGSPSSQHFEQPIDKKNNYSRTFLIYVSHIKDNLNMNWTHHNLHGS